MNITIDWLLSFCKELEGKSFDDFRSEIEEMEHDVGGLDGSDEEYVPSSEEESEDESDDDIVGEQIVFQKCENGFYKLIDSRVVR
tara:strand:+ start:1801 stop:2055 length:255 start_codon:yes stop_codon:yes gene_type:complete